MIKSVLAGFNYVGGGKENAEFVISVISKLLITQPGDSTNQNLSLPPLS